MHLSASCQLEGTHLEGPHRPAVGCIHVAALRRLLRRGRNPGQWSGMSVGAGLSQWGFLSRWVARWGWPAGYYPRSGPWVALNWPQASPRTPAEDAARPWACQVRRRPARAGEPPASPGRVALAGCLAGFSLAFSRCLAVSRGVWLCLAVSRGVSLSSCWLSLARCPMQPARCHVRVARSAGRVIGALAVWKGNLLAVDRG